ncbi:AAA family ATPase [Streptacidiphilus neutrinimicus]|uniref:AAA family ATPase n=1 Tax=Streptacidiphilus neutrinimicus TaxID=105420 RepID=UPI0005AA9D29|nr:SMC family ATPase [Streptacidiphilus neutrinimicus]
MKPQKLSLTGFRSYPHPATVDFTGKNLVAALGDTGAGKSTLLDAITFALFRKSSWDAKEPRQLIADGAQAMSVELTFLHDGQRWHVHRTMHLTNPNAGRHHLENLDTGEQVDGAAAIDARIQAVLQMGYETFLRVGLLPQGKFDQLLTASTMKRTERLRELFGAESLEVVRRMAGRQRDSLKDLLYRARAKRDSMPGNPEQAAADAGTAADEAASQAERLKTSIDTITALRDNAAAARATAAAAATAAQTLSTRTVTDADAALDALDAVAADIAVRRGTLEGRAEAAERQEDELAAALTAAQEQGESREALVKAAMILQNLASDAAEHRNDRDLLATQTRQLADERDAISQAETELAERAEQLTPLATEALTAAQASSEIRKRATKARARVDAALSAAHRTAETAGAHETAIGRLDTLRAGISPLEEEATATDQELTKAEAHQASVQLRDKAAALAAELHPGDDCPVCRQLVPPAFAPASKTDATELSAATTRLSTAKAAHRKAGERLTEARAAVTAAEATVRERAGEYQSAQQKAQEAAAEAVTSLEELVTLADGTRTGFDADSAAQRLNAISATLSLPAADGVTQPSLPDTPEITDAIAACEEAATTNAEQLQAEHHRRAAQIDAQRTTLNGRRTAHERASDQTAAASKRHTRALANTAAEVGTLPRRIQALLPDDAIDVVADQADAAAAAVANRQAEVQSLFDRQETARAEKAAVLADQRSLDREEDTTLHHPLTELSSNLNRWAEAVGEAATHLDPIDQSHLPKTPAEPAIPALRRYAAQLSTTASTLTQKLTERSTTSADRAATAQADLREHAATLTDIEGFDLTADLTEPQALHPLVAAQANALKEAKHQRNNQQEAQALIKPAADLDHAIAAGEARHDALEVLRRELVDAKFLGHLTLLRTHALLGVASDLLGQMSDKRFGFADTFEIVSSDSGVIHHPNRLSGGEKFLASLALALALAELHSRSGPRLGSLFLDEGFAALDTNTLDSALEVLRTQAGSDRLVMVISHLHAVAEAVDDVLWVERGSAGSSARWLTPAERDELVQADLASGLQALAR